MNAAVVRWRKYGKDRLYVTAEDGTKLGHRDLVTGQTHVAVPDRETELHAALGEWDRSQPPAADETAATAASTPDLQPVLPAQRPAEPVADPGNTGDSTPVVETTPSEVPDAAPWEDLAGRRAGEMAREQAVALKQTAPVRTMLARVLGVHTDERAWRIGADGEEKVAAQLAKLAKKDPRWRYLHAIPVGENGSDIDHLVIGPGGVFSLNAKHHPGSKVWVGGNTLMINGQRQPYIRNSRHEARRAGKLLTAACGFPVSVTGMVVPVGADDVTIKTQPEDVHVVYRMALARWLRDRPSVLTDARVEAIFAAARRSTTWQPIG